MVLWGNTKTRPLARAGVESGRWYRPLAVGLTALAVVFGLFVAAQLVGEPVGTDRETYVGAAQRWLAGGPFYYPFQLAGPYEIATGVVLYPPIALYLFVPLSFLPAVAWWAVPLGILAAVIRHHRPAAWAWPLIAACLGFQWSVMILWTGNPTIWVAAFVALGTLGGPWALAVVAKPTLAPFVLVGARRRSWWIGAVVLALLALPFGSMWPDWFNAVTDIYGWRVGPLYSLGDVPLVAAPVIAWLAKARPRVVSSHS